MLTFTDFLRSKVLKEKKILSIFPEERYLTYSLFKKLYTNSNELRLGLRSYAFHGVCKYDPTLVWHTIRAIIKNDINNYEISKEDYRNLGRRNRIISNETFDEIYDNIYVRWYKNIVYDFNDSSNESDAKLWDDMDLISYIYEQIESGEDYYTYPVIFCDETQDFTKKEFNLLFEIHSMINTKVLQQINIIPLAFAGDELQTINPTGFR